jgi:predicted cupin superfamily sugar epimerase
VIARAAELIAALGLQPHPEGGWFRQMFKSEERVIRVSDGANRAALTTIYFLLVQGTFSAWHRVGPGFEFDDFEMTPGPI